MVDDREQAPMDRRRGVLGLLSMALIDGARWEGERSVGGEVSPFEALGMVKWMF